MGTPGRGRALCLHARAMPRKAIAAAAPQHRGELPHRRAGAFLSRRPGQHSPSRGAWRHDRPLLHPASHRGAALVAHMLHVPDAMVTCECRRMGGGFGGKESQAAQWACLAALAAHVTGRPAKCRLDRDDDMIMTGKRHDFRVDYKAGFDDKGRLAGRRCGFPRRAAAIRRTSANASCDRTMFHADNAYFYPAAAHRDRAGCAPIRSPTPPSAALAARRAWSSPSA